MWLSVWQSANRQLYNFHRNGGGAGPVRSLMAHSQALLIRIYSHIFTPVSSTETGCVLLPCWPPQPSTLPTALRADGKAEEKMVRTIMADEAVEGMHVFQVRKRHT